MFKLGDHVRKVRGVYNIGLTGVVSFIAQDINGTNYYSDRLSMLVTIDTACILMDPATSIPDGWAAAGASAWADPKEWEKIAPWEAQDEESVAEELDEELTVPA